MRADPGDAESLVLLGFAYQQRWRETADASNLPRSETALRRALRLDPRDALAVTGLGLARAHPPRLPIGPHPRTEGAAPRAFECARLRGRRGCADRARPLRGGVPRLRADGCAQTERRLVCAYRVRARAPRRPAGRAAGYAARRGRGIRAGRAGRVGERRAGKAGAQSGGDRPCRGAPPHRQGSPSGIRLRLRAARARRRGARRPARRDPLRTRRCRSRAAAAVRRPARRPLRPRGEPARRT